MILLRDSDDIREKTSREIEDILMYLSFFSCLAFVLSTCFATPLYFLFIASEVLFVSFIRQGLAAVLNAFKVVLLHKVQPGGNPAYSLSWKNYIEASLTSSRCLEPCQTPKSDPGPNKINGKITFNCVLV